MRRLLFVLALAAGTLTPASAVPAVAADNTGPGRGLGIRLVDIPVAAADNPRARVYIIDHVRPGALIERRIQVVNNTNTAAEATVYTAAAEIRDGGFIGVEGQQQNELSSWTSVTPRSTLLAPGRRRFADVTIKVPEYASQGERYAAVWAEVTTPPRNPGGIVQVSRVGVRIYLSIGPGGEPASDFTIGSLTAARDDDGTPLVHVLVSNTGGRALDLSGNLRLSHGPGGISAGPYDITRGTTLGLGQTESMSMGLDEQLPNGPWTAHVTIRSGLLTHTATATLTFPSILGVADPVKAKSSNGTTWLSLLGLAIGLLLLLLLLPWYLRHRADQRMRRSEVRARERTAHPLHQDVS